MPVAQTRLETLQICKLLQCVREEDTDQIEKLTINGVPHLINYNEPTEGATAMSIAATANNDTMIEFLCELGGHTDVVDFKGRTSVMRAAEYGHVQCLESLAKRGASMKIVDIEGKGILFYCIAPTKRHEKCMEIALAFGADVNNRSRDGQPVFLKACETAADNQPMCLMLLQQGADPNSKHEKTNRTALMAAAASGSAKVVRAMLERGAEVNQLMLRTKIHAAHEAAKGGFFDVLVALSAFGAIFDQVDDQGNTPIHLAAINGHAMACKFLGQRGCNPKPKNNEGLTARVIAKDSGHKEATKELRKAEKSFGKPGKNSEPWALVLYDFCTERQPQLLEVFKKLDADGAGTLSGDDFVEGLQNVGAPLPEEEELRRIVQTHEKERDVVDYNDFLTGKKYINKAYLMTAFEGKKKKKGKGGKKGKKGKTKIPMVICTQPEGPRAYDGGPPEIYIAKHLHFTDRGRFDRDTPPNNPLHDDSGWYLHHPEKMYINLNDAVKHGDLDSLKDAFSVGTDIDTRDKYYKTPLMVACAYGNLDVAKYLLENGASVSAADNFKWTPLHFACHAGLKDVVEFLLQNGAQLEAPTVNGATPLMRAIESSRIEVVQYLLDKGAKLQVENKKGQNPLDIATAWADSRVYDLIKTKFDSSPSKDKNKKGGKPPGKRPKSGPNENAKETTRPPGGGRHPRYPRHDGGDSPLLDLLPRHRKGSILRAASALAGGIEEKEDITYVPMKTWTEQASTEEVLETREVRRDRYGWEVDFDDFSMPFMKNVYQRVEDEGGLSEGDDED